MEKIFIMKERLYIKISISQINGINKNNNMRYTTIFGVGEGACSIGGSWGGRSSRGWS